MGACWLRKGLEAASCRHSVLSWLFTPQLCPASPDLQLHQCTGLSQASRSLQMLLLPFAWEALLLLVCTAKACVLCSLEGCLQRTSVRSLMVSLGGLEQPFSGACTYHTVWALQACLPIRLQAFVGG